MLDHCPATWNYYDRHCYRIEYFPNANWFSHVSACLSHSSHLLSIRSQPEQVAITGFLNRQFRTTTEYVYIGLRFDNRVPSWEDGRSVQYSNNWRPNHPSFGHRGGDCAYILYTAGIDRDLWGVTDCTYGHTHYHICKRPSGE